VYACTIAAHCNDSGAVSIEHNGRFPVTLLGAFRNGFAGGLDRERRWDAMRQQRVGGRQR
jgi:hypothetical protein